MSRVATNYSTTHLNNGHGQLSRSSSNSSTLNSMTNGGGRGIVVRSAAPPPVQKETVHACPLCNGQYKDPRVLPCTHTYCLTCIRDKLIANNRVKRKKKKKKNLSNLFHFFEFFCYIHLLRGIAFRIVKKS